MVLAVLCSAIFMTTLDLFVVNIALDHIGRSLGDASLSHLSWVLNGYSIVYAALLVPAGRFADRIGRKSGFLVGIALFTFASLGCAASGALWLLVAFRAAQAVGAAILTPSSLGLILTAMPPERVNRSVRVWAATTSIAGAVGPVAGALLVDASWRWIFVINLPIGAAAFLAARRVIPAVTERRTTRMPDLFGGGALLVGVGGLALGLVQAPYWGWASASSVACWFATVAALATFGVRSARHSAPIVDPALFRSHVFAWGTVASGLGSLAFAAALLGVTLFLQRIWGWTALQTGLAIVPGAFMVSIFAIVGQRLGRWLPVGVSAAIGYLVVAAGAIALDVAAHNASAVAIPAAWLSVGVGIGLSFPTVIAAATADLPKDRTATGSAVVNMARQVGSVLGTSLLVVILGSGAADAAIDRFDHVWWFVAAVSIACAAAALAVTPQRGPAPAPLAAGSSAD